MASRTRAALVVWRQRGLAQAEGDVVLDRQPGKAGVLLEHDADAVRDVAGDAAALELDRRRRSATESPAINSSSVDFPQPDGPTTAKNSPLLQIEIDRPERVQAVAADAAGKTLVTPRSET